ncbi:MAG: hypothetical protein AB1394_03020 [Bacteroidota bacterium]
MIKTALFLLGALSFVIAADKSAKRIYSKELFPLSDSKIYIYETSFGDAAIKASLVNGLIETKSEAENFKYYQKLEMRDNGLFIHQTYQWVKLLLVVKKENHVTYKRPLLRYAFPLFVGKEWYDETIEYINNDSNKVFIKGKVLSEENVQTDAGRFSTIKIETVVDSYGGSKNIVTEWIAPNIGLVKAQIEIKGGGIMGFARDILGYGTIEFLLKEIRN